MLIYIHALLRFVQTNSPTLARQGDFLGYIKIWDIPPRRLIFWDGAPSPYKWYQSHAPNLVMCGRSPNSGWRSPEREHGRRCSERHSAAQRKSADTGIVAVKDRVQCSAAKKGVGAGAGTGASGKSTVQCTAAQRLRRKSRLFV